ncbi:MAG: hypothetical protein K2H66_02310 [Oscillospiraceae bacterium]|nr:hypothetical protein [Oscillospiraceae bacterium]
MKCILRKFISSIVCGAITLSSASLVGNITTNATDIEDIPLSLENQISTTASQTSIQVAIDKKTLTLDELKALNYQVPIFIRLEENTGLTTIEFGLQVDRRCDYSVITNSRNAQKLTGETLDINMVCGKNGSFVWTVWASNETDTYMENLLLLVVDIPKTVSGGEKFNIDYQTNGLDSSSKPHRWKNGSKNYVADGEVSYTDGYIEIVKS